MMVAARAKQERVMEDSNRIFGESQSRLDALPDGRAFKIVGSNLTYVFEVLTEFASDESLQNLIACSHCLCPFIEDLQCGGLNEDDALGTYLRRLSDAIHAVVRSIDAAVAERRLFCRNGILSRPDD